MWGVIGLTGAMVCVKLLSLSVAGVRVQLFRTLIFVIGCLLYVAEATYYDFWGERIDVSQYNTTYERE